MATLKTAIVPSKRTIKGTHKIRIAISHKQRTCYIVTRFEVNEKEQTDI